MRHKERTGGDGRVGCVMCIPMKYSTEKKKNVHRFDANENDDEKHQRANDRRQMPFRPINGNPLILNELSRRSPKFT